MAQPKWSSGEWEAVERDFAADGFDIQSGDAGTIARIANPFGHLGDRDDLVDAAREECEATANLIAAAPEMYAALERALVDLKDTGIAPIDYVEAALAKARGERVSA